MSMFEDIRVGKTSSVSRIFANLAEKIARYRVYNATRNELESLTDRELRDINISRHDIRSIAYRAAYDG